MFKKIMFYSLFLSLVLMAACSPNTKTEENIKNPDVWDIVAQVKDSIGEFTFPDKVFNIIDYNATGDGVFDNTQAFKDAIAACVQNQGGIVLVPSGKFLTGPIHLDNNINLRLEEGAEILFTQNKEAYLPLVHTSFEGTEFMNYSPLIYAYQKKNVAITGKGILNGQANNTNWWPWCGKEEYGWVKGKPKQQDEGNRDALIQMADEGVPVENRVFGKGFYFRPNFIETFECEKVLIEGVKIINAPFWVIHPIKCRNVMVDGVTIESHGPNNDGCDPEYSKNVIIKNSTFNTGDDCIAIKSGRDTDGRRVAIISENIIVQNCTMLDGHGGVVMGSEISGGVRNVFVEKCSMNSPNLDRAIRIKTNTRRGGLIENVYVRDLEIGTVKEAVLKINMFYTVYNEPEGEFMPVIRNINLKNIKVKNGGYYAILLKGRVESPITNITLENVVIEKADQDFSIENAKGIKLIDTYINGKLIQSDY